MYIFKITKAKPRADQINLLGVLGCNILFNIVKVSAVATLDLMGSLLEDLF